MKKTGGQVLVETLEKEGVEVVFGYPGGVLLAIYDVLYDSKIRHILPGHEQAGAHAADGYARASGKVGVCIATSGPGAANLTTGIATANMDSVPLVAITGQVATSLIGGDAFQEADIVGVTRPIVKHSYLLKDANDVERTVREAFYLAKTGRPGAVVIDVPKDISVNPVTSKFTGPVKIRGYNPTIKGHIQQIKKAAKLINEAEKPIIYAGGGVIISGANKEMTALARKIEAPVTTTLMGLGGFPETDRLSLEMLGMHGTWYANTAISNSDVIIAIGARFDDRVTGRIEEFAPYAKIIHIDIDPSAISKNVTVDIPIVGDVRTVLKEILPFVKKTTHKSWISQINKWKKEYPLAYKKNGQLKPQYVVEELYNITKGNAIITTEVGQNQMWAAMFYKYTKPRQFISSGGLGTMGYGFPAAIGAKVACPDKTVVDIAGDGSLLMNIQEMATVKRYNIPVKILLLNNSYLGMVRQWQQLFFNRRYAGTDLSANPDFVKVAKAFGMWAKTVDKSKDVKNSIKEMLKYKGPALLDCRVSREENVFPMVPAGAPISTMIMED